MNPTKAFYRVSVKAIIRNKKGELLLVKEHAGNWGLPGGGLDHGETAEAALRRELHEELAVHTVHTAEFAANYTFRHWSRLAWFMWLLYEVEVDSFDYRMAKDATDAAFFDITVLKESRKQIERHIYHALAQQAVQ